MMPMPSPKPQTWSVAVRFSPFEAWMRLVEAQMQVGAAVLDLALAMSPLGVAGAVGRRHAAEPQRSNVFPFAQPARVASAPVPPRLAAAKPVPAKPRPVRTPSVRTPVKPTAKAAVVPKPRTVAPKPAPVAADAAAPKPAPVVKAAAAKSAPRRAPAPAPETAAPPAAPAKAPRASRARRTPATPPQPFGTGE